jgi:hypothetical protein
VTPTPRLRTANYTPAARRQLGEAVVVARAVLGFEEPTGFAKLAGVSPRALWSVENAEPTVGGKVLDKVARAIPWWDAKTPGMILEGAAAPTPPAQITAGDGSQQIGPQATTDFRAVVDIAEGLPREMVIEFVRTGLRLLPDVRARHGQQAHDDAALKLLRLAESTGQTLDDLLRSDAS